MRKNELMSRSKKELESLEKEFNEERKNIYFARVLSNVNNLAKIKEIRRNLAIIKTVLNEYRLGIRH